MSSTVGDFFVSRLHDWGVRRIFGYPGDGINGVIGALQRSSHDIEFIQIRHEEMAAFMASAYSKFSGELASVWPREGQEHPISSPAFTTRSWTTCRCLQPRARRLARYAARTTSRR